MIHAAGVSVTVSLAATANVTYRVSAVSGAQLLPVTSGKKVASWGSHSRGPGSILPRGDIHGMTLADWQSAVIQLLGEALTLEWKAV